MTLGTLPELFEAVARRRPEAIAVVDGARNVTYAELDARANRLAHHLVALGAGAEDVVAVALPRGLDLAVAMLGVSKAGAAYLPLDPAYPAGRIALMLEDARPAVTIATRAAAGGLPDGERARLLLDDAETGRALAARAAEAPTDRERVRPLLPEHLAYVIFTSGSTGRPKGVAVPHAGIGGMVAAQSNVLGADEGSRVLQIASPSFDVSVWEMAMALLLGGTLVVAPGEARVSARSVADLVRNEAVTHATVGPALLAELAQGSLPAGFTLITAGEACAADLVERWAPGRRMFNGYGPTETTVCATISDPLVPGGTPPIGRAIADLRLHVLDERLSAVPGGGDGELYVAGVGLARGYLGRPDLTAERFLPDPSGPPGSRMYRTGDLVRWRPDGQLDFLGRADGQMKLRGVRIEPGEIEAVLRRHPAVDGAAAVIREDRAGDPRLVAYVVPAAGARPEPAELRAHAAASLMEAMVPSAVVLLDALPLTPSGKVDRRALPAPTEQAAAASGERARSGREAVLGALFAEVLGVAEPGLDDSFLDLGGNSLLGARLLGRLRETFGVEPGLDALFEAPTVRALAARLDGATRTGPPLVALASGDAVPLSFAQSRLWFLHRLEGSGPTYHVPLALRLSGDLDVDALRMALADVVERHDVLRTVVSEVQGAPRPVVREAGPPLALSDCSPDALGAAIEAEVGHPFDLASEPPLRARLLRLAPGEHVLLVTIHHIATDGWSTGILARDLGVAYAARREGREPAWRPLPLRYSDFAVWQRERLGREDDPDSLVARDLAYWREALAGAPAELPLPADRSRPPVASHRGGSVPVTIGAELHRRLLALAGEGRCSLFMVLHAGLAALLTRLGAGTDVPIGTVIAGRPAPALEELVGFFVETVVLRTDTSGDPTFRELLERVRAVDLAAYAHDETPFERLVEVLNPERSLSRQPLFQVLLTFQGGLPAEVSMPGLRARIEPLGTTTAKFDLTVALDERRGADGAPGGIDGSIEFATDLFDRATVETIGRRLVRLLEAAASGPDQPIGALALMDDAERRALSSWASMLGGER